MSKSDRDADRLEFILEMIRRIEDQFSKHPPSAFESKGDQVDLLAFRIGQIGETTNKLSAELVARHPEIEWPRIYRMRNIIIHAYTDLIPSILRNAATDDVPQLKAVCETELARLLDE